VIGIFLLFFPHSLPQPLSRPAGRKRGASFGQLFKGSEFNLTANFDRWRFSCVLFRYPQRITGDLFFYLRYPPRTTVATGCD